MGKRTKAEWRRDVFKSTDPRMTGSVKVLCLYLADHMTAERHVSLPRSVMAEALGVHEQRVAERLKKAIQADFLLRVRAGKPGCTAEFQGCWPVVHSGRRPRSGGGVRTAPQDALRTAPQDALPEPRGAVRTPEVDPTNGAGVRTALRDANKQLPLNGWVETEQREPPEWLDSDDAAEDARSAS